MSGSSFFKTGIQLLMCLSIGLFGYLGFGAMQKLILNWELASLTVIQRLHTSPRHHPIALITIDAATQGNALYMELFGSLYNRRAFGYVVRYLNQAKAKAIGLDVSFNGGLIRQDPADSAFLVKAVQQSQVPTYSQLIFENQGKATQPKPEVSRLLQANAIALRNRDVFPFLQQFNFESLVPPYTQLLKTPMRFYAANTQIAMTDSSQLGQTQDGPQGVLRRWLPFVFYRGEAYVSFPLGLRVHGEKGLSLSPNGQLRWPGGSLDLGPDGSPLIHWYGHGVDPTHPVYPETSMGDVVLSQLKQECSQPISEDPELCKKLEGHSIPIIPPARFQNQYVVVGNTLTNMDEHPTIYSPKYPGVYIVCNVLDNVLGNDFVLPAPGWANLLVIVGLPSLLGLLLLRYRSILLGLLFTTMLCVSDFAFTVHAYYEWKRWFYTASPILAMMACFSGIYVWQYLQERNQKAKMQYAFGKYVSPAVLKLISENPDRLSLGGTKREMSFLFSDIRGFTAFSDHNEPEAVQAFLTQYFSTMNGIILNRYQGSINKLMGDAIMAYWGFPLDHEDHAFLAVSAALAMQEAMINWRKESDKLPIHIGIGINTGEAMIGNVGSEDFMDFTVIGDAVNVASRLEGLNKEYGTHIVISAATYAQVKDRVRVRSLGWASLKGKEEKFEIYEPIGFLER